MIKYKQEYNTSGSGLGSQISAYILMKSLEKDTGFEWTIAKNDFTLFRNTFDVSLNIDDNSVICKELELDDEIGYNGIKSSISDNIELFVYPTIKNINSEYTVNLTEELKFRQEIVDKCRAFRDKFDGEVIAMHIRRGDFYELSSGMFVCGADYYRRALDELPPDIPVLIFANDKEDVIADNELIASNPQRFTFITDLYNDNELINCDVGQEMDHMVDNDGKNVKFNYKHALVKLAHNTLSRFAADTNGYTMDQLKVTVKELSQSLHSTYKKKMKSQLYNASFDLCLMTMCDYFIMANSSFGMWGATMGNPKKVIYPMYWLQGHGNEYEDHVVEGMSNGGQTFIKTDLDGFDQTKYLGGSFIKDHFIPLENPDPRSFEVVS